MGACFGLCGRDYLALGANPRSHFLAQVFLESRLSSDSLEPLFGLLAYLEPKIWLKIGKNSSPVVYNERKLF